MSTATDFVCDANKLPLNSDYNIGDERIVIQPPPPWQTHAGMNVFSKLIAHVHFQKRAPVLSRFPTPMEMCTHVLSFAVRKSLSPHPVDVVKEEKEKRTRPRTAFRLCTHTPHICQLCVNRGTLRIVLSITVCVDDDDDDDGE